jgi:GH25 family lysozyme M1 (1,4-beta-N-acetylmuramidase)
MSQSLTVARVSANARFTPITKFTRVRTINAGTLPGVTGLRGRASILGGALIMTAGLAVPATLATTSSAAIVPVPAIGVDVSRYTTFTSSTPWADLKAAGVSFVGVEATFARTPETTYPADVEGAAAAGLYVLPYAFAFPYNPKSNGTIAEQATAAVTTVKSVTSPAYAASPLMLPLVVDLEFDPYYQQEGTTQCYGLSQSAMVSWIKAFLGDVKALGKTPIIYTQQSFWHKCAADTTAFSGNPLWLAEYGLANPPLPAGWNNYTFWQYTSRGTVNGIKGGTDLDYLGPELQVSQAGKAIAPVQLRTLNGLAGQPASFTPATLLPGVSVDSAGRVTGTPSTIGKYTVTATPSSAGAVPSAMSFTWDVHGKLTVNSPGNRATVMGTPVRLRVTASDQDGPGFPPSFAASGLPPGLSINPAGQVTGWPARPGSYTVTVPATDGLFAAGSATFTWTVNQAPNSGTAGPVRQFGGTGKCLDDPSSNTANGTVVDLSTCTGRSSQSWTTATDGTLRALGKCLGIVGDSKSSGARLQLVACSPRDGAQLWQAATDSQLVNPRSGKCLDVPVARAANGTKPVIEPCASSATQPSQHWLRPAAPIVSGFPGKCLAVAGSPAVMAGCANTASQHWQPQPDGTIRLAGKCLTAGGTTAGSVLRLGTCTGAAATKWTLIQAGPIAAKLASAASGLCLTAPSAGTRATIASCASTPAGTWHVE